MRIRSGSGDTQRTQHTDITEYTARLFIVMPMAVEELFSLLIFTRISKLLFIKAIQVQDKKDLK